VPAKKILQNYFLSLENFLKPSNKSKHKFRTGDVLGQETLNIILFGTFLMNGHNHHVTLIFLNSSELIIIIGITESSAIVLKYLFC
jgi:hypothetical protein